MSPQVGVVDCDASFSCSGGTPKPMATCLPFVVCGEGSPPSWTMLDPSSAAPPSPPIDRPGKEHAAPPAPPVLLGVTPVVGGSHATRETVLDLGRAEGR